METTAATPTKGTTFTNDYLELRRTFLAVLDSKTEDRPIFDKYLLLPHKEMAKALESLFNFAKTASKDIRIATFDFICRKSDSRLLTLLYEHSFYIPKPVDVKYSNVEINFVNTGMKESGLKMALDLQLKSKELSDELTILGKPFNVGAEDYFFTLSFDALKDPETATNMAKDMVKTFMAMTMLEAVAYKVAGCFEVKADRVDNKVITCVRIKPEYRVLAMGIYDLLRCIFPLEGENESIHAEWMGEGDGESLATSKESLTRILMKHWIKYAAHVHTEHYQTIIGLLKSVMFQRKPPQIVETLVFGIVGMLSGKATIRYSREDTPEEGKKEFAEYETIAFKIKRLHDTREIKHLVEKVPLFKKLFDLLVGYVENVDLAIYLPGLRLKGSVMIKNFNKLLTPLIQ